MLPLLLTLHCTVFRGRVSFECPRLAISLCKSCVLFVLVFFNRHRLPSRQSFFLYFLFFFFIVVIVVVDIIVNGLYNIVIVFIVCCVDCYLLKILRIFQMRNHHTQFLFFVSFEIKSYKKIWKIQIKIKKKRNKKLNKNIKKQTNKQT